MHRLKKAENYLDSNTAHSSTKVIHPDESYINYVYDRNGNRRAKNGPNCGQNTYWWDEEDRRIK